MLIFLTTTKVVVPYIYYSTSALSRPNFVLVSTDSIVLLLLILNITFWLQKVVKKIDIVC